MMHFFRNYLLIALVFFVLPAFSQQYTFIEYNLKEGLPQSQVRCMMQDSRGFFWIGTLGGLSRFDGREFLNYDRQDGFLNNQVNCIIQLSDGTIVAGSNGSFSMINGNGVVSVQLHDNFLESTINALYQDGDTLWIGTETGLLLYSISNRDFLIQSENLQRLGRSHIKTLHKRKDEMFILTKEKLVILENGVLSDFYVSSFSETVFFDLAETSDGRIWLASKGEGLVQISAEGQFVRNYLDEPRLTSNVITGITVDHLGQLWLSSRFGFFQFSERGCFAYSEKNGLKTPDIRDILEDREGNIWLGTYGGGLLKFTGKVFSSYTVKDGLSSDAVMSITEDTQGNHWFSTYDKGLCLQTTDTIIQYSLSELTDNNRIWTSIRDHEGTLWFGSSDGLFRFKNGKFDLFTDSDSLSNTMVLSLFEDDQNRLWIGTQKGLTIMSGGKFSPIQNTNSPQKKIRSIKQDLSGNLWFASIDGVFKFDGNQFSVYSQKDGLAENSTSCIEIDGLNRVWVGTQNGVSVMDNDHFVSSSIDNNSGANVVNFLKFYHGRLWVGTNKGLYSIKAEKDFKVDEMHFRHYGLEDGLRSLETNLNAVFVDSKDQFWFGTTDGVTLLNTNVLDEPRGIVAPAVILTKIQINLQDQDWSKLWKSIDPTTGLAVQPELKYKQNHLTFYFTGISTTYPEAVMYQYMLEGLDDDWKTVTNVNFATYSNLPYRSFLFKVRAMSAEGMWSEPVSYAFSVSPPFWLTWWFISLEILAASAILLVVILNRRRALIAKREKEWFEMKSRMLALEQQSLNSSMNRHFIFNALNSIQYYINRQDRVAANRYLSDFAKLIRKNLDSSQDNLTTLRDEIERLELYLKLEHMRFRDKFEYEINVDSNLNQDAVKVPAMLVQPFLENSIWHGLLPKESLGHVVVDIRKQADTVVFTITDNGIGIENSLKNKTTADNHISKGMQITQNRIELIKKTTGNGIELYGPLQIEAGDTSESGTLVRITIPFNLSEHFSQ